MNREKERLRESILEENLLTAGRNLAEAVRESRETRNNLAREIRKLENREEAQRANRFFLEEYLKEMEGKYTHGLIPEVEFLKAQDQRRLLVLDEKLLNLDRYLLNNELTSHLTEAE